MKRANDNKNSRTPSVSVDAAEAFAAVAEEIAAVGDEEVLSINLDIEKAASIALAASSNLKPLSASFKALPEFDGLAPQRLRSYALAALYAHIVATEVGVEEDRFTPLLEEATRLRELLLGAAEMLALFGLVSSERVAEIRAGTGHLDTASDLIALCALYGESWGRVGGKTPVTREQVERAGVVGTQLHELVAARRFATPVDPSPNDAQRTRARAFTLLVRKYDECRRGVAYLRWKFGDADAFAPSMYSKSRRRAAASDDDAPRTDAPTTPSSAEPPSPIGDLTVD